MIPNRSMMQEGLMNKEINKYVHKFYLIFLYRNYNNIYLGAFRKRENQILNIKTNNSGRWAQNVNDLQGSCIICEKD